MVWRDLCVNPPSKQVPIKRIISEVLNHTDGRAGASGGSACIWRWQQRGELDTRRLCQLISNGNVLV